MELQKTLKTQWVDLENWSAKAPWRLDDTELLVTIFYEIVNPTDMPLTVKRVEVSTGSGRNKSASEFVLNPKSRKLMSVPFSFADKERIDLYFGGDLVINIFGTVTFKNNFGKLQRQLFGEVCKGGVGEHDGDSGFSFERFDAWLPSEDAENQQNT